MKIVKTTKARQKDRPPHKLGHSWQEQMVLQYAPLIRYIASRLALRLPAHISQDDLISSGIVGLIDAIRKYDRSKNIDFKIYAEFRIKGAMLDELRGIDWIPRSILEKTNLIENAYARLQKVKGRPAEAEEVANLLDMELEDFYQLLDETKKISIVGADSCDRKITGGLERKQDFWEFGLLVERAILSHYQNTDEATGVEQVGCGDLSVSKIGQLASNILSKKRILYRKKKRFKKRKEIYIFPPEFIEHDTIIKMEPKARVRVELKIREFREAEPPTIVEPEVLVDG